MTSPLSPIDLVKDLINGVECVYVGITEADARGHT